jgi:hypothetical protein
VTTQLSSRIGRFMISGRYYWSAHASVVVSKLEVVSLSKEVTGGFDCG